MAGMQPPHLSFGELVTQNADGTPRIYAVPGEAAARPPIQPVNTDDRSFNPLRPRTLDEMVGQELLKPLLRRVIDAAISSGRPLDHMLLVGASGTGKTTVAHVVAHELGRRVFQVDAPVSQETLLDLREAMWDGDLLFCDELHQQVVSDRRGSGKAAQAETFFGCMEDRVIVTPRGVLPFPKITVIGATTDAGLLPEPFLARFPLQPRLARYTVDEMALLAKRNADALGLGIDEDAAMMLARASRMNPRCLNRYVRNAQTLGATHVVDTAIAREIIEDLNSTELDGLTADMCGMLRFLYTSGRRETRGEVRFQASVNTISTALGKSRDTKAIALFVEPELIERGLVQVAAAGRTLTDAGIERARQLTEKG